MAEQSSGLAQASFFNIIHLLKDTIIAGLGGVIGGLSAQAFGLVAVLAAVYYGRQAMSAGGMLSKVVLGLTAAAAALTGLQIFGVSILPGFGVPLAVVALVLPLLANLLPSVGVKI